jgi:heterodisulfide reductase subunit D
MQALETWQKQGNPFGEDLSAIVRNHVPEKYLDGSAEVLLFSGCTTLHYHPANLEAIVRVLEALRVDFRVLYQGRICCGNPIHTLGHRETFSAHSRELMARLAGWKTIVSPCPTCVYYLKEVYARMGLKPAGEVLHISEYVAARLNQLSVREPVDQKVIFHDPCHLGRYLGVYDPPRLILEKATGQQPLEFYEHREAGTCCGGGGGVPLTHPQTARAIGQNKMQDFARSGAELLATACPMCQRMLGRSGREQGAVVEDVIALLAQSLGPQG